MGRIGRFDTDSGALQRRIQAHDAFGKNDLNRWLFEQLAPEAGMRVLDLGCGTGKQSVPLAERVGPGGAVVSYDASEESLRALREEAERRGVADRVRMVQDRLDALPKALAGEASFDRVVASYSLYYTEDAKALTAAIAAKMNPGGVLFFCGPSPDNNAELKAFHHGLRDTEPTLVEAAQFMTATGPEACANAFAQVTRHTFENPLAFRSVDALLEYWRSYNLFDENLEDDFSAAARAHFAEHADFTTVKRVLGVRAVAP